MDIFIIEQSNKQKELVQYSLHGSRLAANICLVDQVNAQKKALGRVLFGDENNSEISDRTPTPDARGYVKEWVITVCGRPHWFFRVVQKTLAQTGIWPPCL